jgi:hypothetical protein
MSRQPPSARSSSLLAVAALVSITLAFYHGLWLPGLVLLKRDAFRFYLPIKQYLIERLSAGELPQWFPYDGLGRPGIGTTVTGVFHPFTMLYTLFPVPDAYRASTLLSCLLAAFGAFMLGRMLALSRTGALVAGLAFALSGYVVSLTDNLLFLYSICLLPLFCAALEKALRDSRAWTAVPAAIWATVFLIGDVQTGYYYIFIALLWTALRAPESYGEAGIRLALVGGLTVMLAGIQLGPSAAVFVGSDRLQPADFHSQALYWSTHPLRLLTMLVSPIGEKVNPIELGRLFFDIPHQVIIGGFWAESLYLGIPMAGLALLGAWHRRDLRVLTLLGCFALILSLGRFGGLYEAFYHVVPFWSAFRYPEKLAGVASLAAAVLAGAGVDAVRNGKGSPAPWLAAALLCLGAGLALGTEVAVAWGAAHFGAPAALAREVIGSAATAFFFSAAGALGLWLVLVGVRRRWLRMEWALALLVALLTLDLARANLAAYHTGPVEMATFTPPLAEALQAREGTLEPGRFRLISFDENKVIIPEPMSRWLGFYGSTSVERRQALDLLHHTQFHIESIRGYLPGFGAAFAAMFGQGLGVEATARYNVTYYTGRRYHFNDPRFAKAFVAQLPDYDLALFRNPVPAKPRAYLSRHPERAVLPFDPVALLKRPDFLNGEVDVIETTDATLPGPALGGSAVIERYASEEVRVRVETPQPAVLVLLDAFDQGWTATLDGGIELPIMRADALVRAVAVPAGAHVVTFSYQAPLLRAGALASLAGTLICAGLLAHARRRTRPVDTG